MSENAFLSSRLQFIVDGEDLYKFQVENEKFDLFIRSVLRSYGGAFDQFVNIKETEIAKKNNMSRVEVMKYLHELNTLEVISYQKQTDQPLLTFIKPRYKTEDVIIDKRYYEERKTIYQQKMKAMLAFVQEEKCRSMQILQYFEESDAQKCGVCDVCLAEKRNQNNDVKRQQTKIIINALAQQPLTLQELVKVIQKGSEDDKLALIRLMLDAGEIKKKADLYLV